MTEVLSPSFPLLFSAVQISKNKNFLKHPTLFLGLLPHSMNCSVCSFTSFNPLAPPASSGRANPAFGDLALLDPPEPTAPIQDAPQLQQTPGTATRWRRSPEGSCSCCGWDALPDRN